MNLRADGLTVDLLSAPDEVGQQSLPIAPPLSPQIWRWYQTADPRFNKQVFQEPSRPRAEDPSDSTAASD
jgi:hypothetical protein